MDTAIQGLEEWTITSKERLIVATSDINKKYLRKNQKGTIKKSMKKKKKKRGREKNNNFKQQTKKKAHLMT